MAAATDWFVECSFSVTPVVIDLLFSVDDSFHLYSAFSALFHILFCGTVFRILARNNYLMVFSYFNFSRRFIFSTGQKSG